MLITGGPLQGVPCWAQRLFLATPILRLDYGVADVITLTSLLYFASNVFASFIVPERIA